MNSEASLPSSTTYRTARMTGLRSGSPRPVILKTGLPSVEVVEHVWCVCDVCAEGMLIAAGDLAAVWVCGECKRKSELITLRTEAPVCTGRKQEGTVVEHDPVEMTTEDPRPGKPCRMTPKCQGRQRRGT